MLDLARTAGVAVHVVRGSRITAAEHDQENVIGAFHSGAIITTRGLIHHAGSRPELEPLL